MQSDSVLVFDSDHEGRNVDDSAVDSDVASLDEAAGVVNGASDFELEDAGLQTSFEHLVQSDGEDVIESVLFFLVQEAVLEHSVQKCVAFKDSAFIVLLQSQQVSRSLTHLRKCKLCAPDLSLVLETVVAAELNLVVDTLLFEHVLWTLAGLAV